MATAIAIAKLWLTNQLTEMLNFIENVMKVTGIMVEFKNVDIKGNG